MKKEKLTSILYASASVCFFVAAGIGYANDNPYATVWMCLGSAILCIRAASLNKKEDKHGRDGNDTDKNGKCQ